MKKLLALTVLPIAFTALFFAGCTTTDATQGRPDTVQERTDEDDCDDGCQPNIIPRKPHFPPKPERDNRIPPVPLPTPELPK